MKIFKRKMFCEPLRENECNRELIQAFRIYREDEYRGMEGKVIGLEAFLKYCAWEQDEKGLIKVYLVKTYFTNEIVAYFALRAGLISVDCDDRDYQREKVAKRAGTKLVPDTIPGIEISHFAVNDCYREKYSKAGLLIKGLGKYIYPEFIYPIISDIKSKLGVNILYLYAAGDKTLINYYREVFGFLELNYDSKLVPVTSYYDDYCEFMYRSI